jgi:hypothetical protein
LTSLIVISLKSNLEDSKFLKGKKENISSNC